MKITITEKIINELVNLCHEDKENNASHFTLAEIKSDDTTYKFSVLCEKTMNEKNDKEPQTNN